MFGDVGRVDRGKLSTLISTEGDMNSSSVALMLLAVTWLRTASSMNMVDSQKCNLIHSS